MYKNRNYTLDLVQLISQLTKWRFDHIICFQAEYIIALVGNLVVIIT